LANGQAETTQDFFSAWGGISGCQSLLAVLLSEGYTRRRLPLATIVSATSHYVAQRFGLAPHKGQLAVGADADLALVDLVQPYVLRADDLFYRHRHSPYVGRSFCGRVRQTLLSGTPVFQDGRIVATTPAGRLLAPSGV
jgi:allantoinase